MVERLEEGSVAVEVNLNYFFSSKQPNFHILLLTFFCNVDHQVTIQRRLLSIILTTFLPTLIVNIVGHMSNYFKEFFFEVFTISS